jgi:hypothetical protein
MSLAFPNASRSIDPARRAVRFWGHESQFEYTFYVDIEALRRLGADESDEASLLRTFDANRPRIEAAAGALHGRGRQSFYRLTSSEL